MKLDSGNGFVDLPGIIADNTDRHGATAGGRCPPRGNHVSIGKKLTSIVEEHDSVAQQAPALFGISDNRPSRIAVGSRRSGAPGKMVTCSR